MSRRLSTWCITNNYIWIMHSQHNEQLLNVLKIFQLKIIFDICVSKHNSGRWGLINRNLKLAYPKIRSSKITGQKPTRWIQQWVMLFNSTIDWFMDVLAAVSDIYKSSNVHLREKFFKNWSYKILSTNNKVWSQDKLLWNI